VRLEVRDEELSDGIFIVADGFDFAECAVQGQEWGRSDDIREVLRERL
jgi:hypothetical protein